MATSKIPSHGWKLIQEGTYQTTGTLDLTQYNEICMTANPPGSGMWYSITIPSMMLLDTYRHFGCDGTAEVKFGTVTVSWWAKQTGMYLDVTVNGGNQSGSTPFKLFGKR